MHIDAILSVVICSLLCLLFGLLLQLTICFAERAEADVVECACLIGLPKFKVLSLDSQLI